MFDIKNPSSPEKVGKNQVANFVKRHPELSSVHNRNFDIQRAEVEDPKLISLWFKLVGDIITKYGVLQEDIFNFEKTGFQMGVISTSKVITTSDRMGKPRTKQLGNRKWVTAIEAISARGHAIPPFTLSSSIASFIRQHNTKLALQFPGKSLLAITGGLTISYASNGSSTSTNTRRNAKADRGC